MRRFQLTSKLGQTWPFDEGKREPLRGNCRVGKGFFQIRRFPQPPRCLPHIHRKETYGKAHFLDGPLGVSVLSPFDLNALQMRERSGPLIEALIDAIGAIFWIEDEAIPEDQQNHHERREHERQIGENKRRQHHPRRKAGHCEVPRLSGVPINDDERVRRFLHRRGSKDRVDGAGVVTRAKGMKSIGGQPKALERPMPT